MNALGDLAPRWSEISALLDEALELPPSQRASWLDTLDGERAALKDTVRRLLEARASVETGDFLDTLPRLKHPVEATDDAMAAKPGALVGPYQLISELGHGGMGAVWLAERADGTLKRQVALKLPHMSWARNIAERMARERDILATLEHPNIARLYDAGVDSMGRPWLALEYVQGRAIDVFARERSLEVRARLDLLLQVCSAVAYAHSRLVIHRDLKPSNILVTDEGQVRLLDFGIAKLLEGEHTEETALTREAGRALTLDYASPEQVRGEPLSTASDVYSLGVVAYELLAGRRPYRLARGSAAELEQAIVEADDVAVSSATDDPLLRRQLRGDLDAILHKTLHKDAQQRYRSVDALADDIRRHLRQEPVQAQPDRLLYRVGKLLRRHRWQMGAAFAVVAALTVGLAASIWQARRATEQAERAEEVKRFVLSLFEDADTGRSAGHRSTTALELLQRARERLRAMKGADPGVASELLKAVGDSLIGLGDLEQAELVLDDALTLARSSFGDEGLPTARAQLALGELQIESGKEKQAGPHLEAALVGLRRHGVPRETMNALRWMSVLRQIQGRPNEAVAFAQEAASLADGLPATDLRSRMLAQHTLSDALHAADQPGRVAAARRAYDLSRLVHGDKRTVDVLTAQSQLAFALQAEGDAAAALAQLKALLPEQIALLGAAHGEVVRTHGRTALAALMLGDPHTAVEHYRRAREILLQQDAGRSPGTDAVLATLQLGVALVAARRLQEADGFITQAVDALSGNPTFLHRALMQSVAVKVRLGELAGADAAAQRLTAHLPNAIPRDAAVIALRTGVLRSAQGRHEEALENLDKARSYFESRAAPADQARWLAAQGEALLAAGRAEEALQILQQADARLEQAQPALSPERAELLTSLAAAHLALSHAALALPLATRAAQRWQELDADNRSAGLAWLWLGRAQHAEGQDGKAAFARADRILTRSGLPADRALMAQVGREMSGPAR